MNSGRSGHWYVQLLLLLSVCVYSVPLSGTPPHSSVATTGSRRSSGVEPQSFTAVTLVSRWDWLRTMIEDSVLETEPLGPSLEIAVIRQFSSTVNAMRAAPE